MSSLKPYAVADNLFTKREYFEDKHPYRTDFQRDKDRIVHSSAFRRLEYKTQVFINSWGDNYRTRLTHSIEVAQISRSVSRALCLNEDLTEAIALAHDIGHPPFGHAGERALNSLLEEHHGFDHNKQTLRVLTLLETRYPQFMGLNLTEGTLTGLQKHSIQVNGKSHFLEALTVDICDEIAYHNHDIDDGLSSGLLHQTDLISEVSLWRSTWNEIIQKYPTCKESILIKYTIRCLINRMVEDLIQNTKNHIKEMNIHTLEDALDVHHKFAKKQIVCFSNTMRQQSIELKKFLFKKLYRHPEVNKMNARAKEIIIRIYSFLLKNTNSMPQEYQDRIHKSGKERCVCDFIAGMTDRYALEWNKYILGGL